jgi:hypothetical protein
MTDSKRPNIIWILVDSARIYHTDADERGRLDAMDDFAKEAIDFRTAITAAPSTIMSVSAMMTGTPASYHSRDYISFKGSFSQLHSLPAILREEDYKTYGILFWPDGREFLSKLFGDNCKDLWEKDYDKNKYWSNDEQIEIFDRFLESDKINDRFFVWLHLNCRFDKDISRKVNYVIDRIKEKGLYDDAIIVMNSDHGYPDPSRGISFYDKRKFGHDLIMSDDNILAPQLIKLPGIQAKRINEPISTLDLFPTILDYLGLKKHFDFSAFPTSGMSQLPFINGLEAYKPRKVRTDNRFIFQQNMVVALRNHRYKYIYYCDEDREEFFDITEDAYEENNLILSAPSHPAINEFREEYRREQDGIIAYHTEILRKKIEHYIESGKDYTLIGDLNHNFIKIFKDIFDKRGIALSERTCQDNDQIKILSSTDDYKRSTVMIFPVSKLPKLNSQIAKYGKTIKRKKELIVLNYNIDKIKIPDNWFIYSLKKSKKWFLAFRYDPKTILTDLFVQIKRVVRNEKT